ncbi:MAG: ATPase [Microscillaceae bacterium]|nr:ATPase [Microscillaceae bacterium]MDW8459715.1 DUF4175 family protein [Cytophagales bacterium]
MEILLKELHAYKQKYYLNELLKGFLISTALVLTAFLLFNTLEYFGRLNTTGRAILFYTFIGLASFTSIVWILLPISYLLHLNSQISDEEAAKQIGDFFPEVRDKLLNTLQLSKQPIEQNTLLAAAIQQKTKELTVVKFTDAIQYEKNKRYLPYLLPPLFLLLLILFINANFFTESSHRIINYHKVFQTPAPFEFQLISQKLQAFKNEDFTFQVRLVGKSIPQEVYLWANGKKYKLSQDAKDFSQFSYTFSKLSKTTDFYLEAAGFNSNTYQIQVLERPELLAFSANLTYPAYLRKPAERWNNIGNLIVPEGTQIEWHFETAQADNLLLKFESTPNTQNAHKKSKGFTFKKIARSSENYEIRLKNQFSENKEPINYFINVIPDQYPRIAMQEYRDTAIYNYISVGGNIADDYGFSQLKLFYSIIRKDKPSDYQAVNIPIHLEQTIQNFYYQLDLAPLNLQPGDAITFFAQVWDNDGVNGAKSAKTQTFHFKIPKPEELKEAINHAISQTTQNMDKALQRAKNLQKDIENLKIRLQSKANTDFQDKKALEELIKKRNELNEEIKKLQQEVKQLEEKQERFSEINEELAEKMQQLQELMRDLLDEETKRLYEELQRLLEQQKDKDSILEMLNKIDNKEDNLEKELDRALEMFKQLQFEQKLEQAIKDLKEIAEQQDKLADKTTEKNPNQEQLQQEQQELNEKFENLKKELDELEKMDKELENPNGMKDKSEQEKEIQQELQKSSENLKNKKNKDAQKAQKNAAQKMKKMAQELEQMQQEMQSEQDAEDIDALRAILENLVKLSFDQEALMKEFRVVNTSDPRFVKLAQDQLKIKEDAKIVEDSLYALAKRVFQIKSFVTRELSEMKNAMNEATEMIKQRKISQATSKQQFAMTAMNNLALMLSDALKNMQDQAAQQQASSKAGKGKKQKQGKQPNLSELQKQLNQQIEQLKNSQKTGKQLSEELAKLAAQQERIRRQLRELEKKQGAKGEEGRQLSNQLKELQKLMEETEKELVNKNLSAKTIQRQKEIVTRLLESEKALREQGEEEQRKAETAKQKEKTIPPALNQFFKQKEKQTELLKTVPPSLSPYYKKKVDEYFEKINR